MTGGYPQFPKETPRDGPKGDPKSRKIIHENGPKSTTKSAIVLWNPIKEWTKAKGRQGFVQKWGPF